MVLEAHPPHSHITTLLASGAGSTLHVTTLLASGDGSIMVSPLLLATPIAK